MRFVATLFACALLIGAATIGRAQEGSAPVSRSVTVPPRSPEVTNVPLVQLGTSKAPIVVRTIESAEDAAERSEAAAHRSWERANGSTTIYVAATMAVLALLQLLLFLWQLSLMRETVEDASRAAGAASSAAGAADLSAKAAISIEMPIITASIFGLMATNSAADPYDPPGGSVNVGYPHKHASVGPFLFKNSGRSAAVLEHIKLGWMAADELPPLPNYLTLVPLEHFSIIGPGEEFQSPYHLNVELMAEEREDVRAGRSLIWVYGVLVYRDFMDYRHELGFCFHYEKRPRGNLNPFAFFKDGRPSAYTNHKVERPWLG